MRPIFYILAVSILAFTPSSGFTQKQANSKQTAVTTHHVDSDGESTAVDVAAEPDFGSHVADTKTANTNRFGPGLSAPKKKEKHDKQEIPILRYMLSTVAIIALMIGVLWAMNRLNTRYSGSRRGSLIRLTNRVHLDNKNSLALVHLRDQELLIGIGANAMTLLHTNPHASRQSEPESTND